MKEKQEIGVPKIDYEWNGEQIRRRTTFPDQNIDPKDHLNEMDMHRSRIDQMKGIQEKIEGELEKQKKAIIKGEGFIKEMEEFEERCIQIQKDKLDLFVRQIENEGAYKEQAEKEAAEEIQKDPSAYTEDQKLNLKYTKYQHKLGTDEKIAKRICKRIITQYLYDKPIFKNPFAVEPIDTENNPEGTPDATPEQEKQIAEAEKEKEEHAKQEEHAKNEEKEGTITPEAKE